MARDNNDSFSSGMLGLIFGFVAGVAAVILSDPENRQKVVKATSSMANSAKDTISTVADTIKENSEKLNTAVQNKVDEIDQAVTNEIEKTEADKV